MLLLSQFLRQIISIDQTVLFHINQVWANNLFDVIMPWFREPGVWLPLYAFFIAFVLINFGFRGLYWVIFFVVTVTFCDQISNFFKHWIERPRPCNDPVMMLYIKMRLEYCSSSFSFTSSHAANHFGMAMFIFQTFKKSISSKTGWLFLWAFSICYAQMYVGIHYPTDILGGTVIGLSSGYLFSSIFNRRIGFYKKEAVVSNAVV